MLERARLAAATRTVVVLIVCGFALLNVSTDLSRAFGRPNGDYGLRTSGTVVNSVEPGSAAAKVGLHAGDAISLADNSPFIRRTAIRGFAPAPGTPLRLTVLSPTRKSVVVVAAPEPSANVPYLVARQTAYVLCILLAAALLLLRPSVSTWGLFLYSLNAVGVARTVLTILLHDTPLFWLDAAMDVLLDAASVFGLVLLCVSLARRKLQVADKLLLGAAALLGLSFAIAEPGQPIPIPNLSDAASARISSVLILIVYLLAAFALARSLRLAPERFRARIEWIGLGVILSAAAGSVKYLLVSIESPYETYALTSILNLVPATVFATSAYALLRERIVAVNFVVSRALVYAILTSTTVGILALVDWFVSARIAQVRLGFLLELCAAIGLGFALQRMHEWSDKIVDRFVFRSVHDAEVALKRLGATLVHAPSRDVIDRIVCREAAKAASLASAAVFHRSDADSFLRSCSLGWPDDAVRRLGAGHQLALYLMTEERPLVPIEAFGAKDVLPRGVAAPALALPCIVQHELIAFVLYGSHSSGAQPDVKDIELLREFAERATAAYEHVEGVSRAEKIRALQTENEVLRTMLGAAQVSLRNVTPHDVAETPSES